MWVRVTFSELSKLGAASWNAWNNNNTEIAPKTHNLLRTSLYEMWNSLRLPMSPSGSGSLESAYSSCAALPVHHNARPKQPPRDWMPGDDDNDGDRWKAQETKDKKATEDTSATPTLSHATITMVMATTTEHRSRMDAGPAWGYPDRRVCSGGWIHPAIKKAGRCRGTREVQQAVARGCPPERSTTQAVGHNAILGSVPRSLARLRQRTCTYSHGRTRPDNLVKSVVRLSAASQHCVPRPQDPKKGAGDGVGAAEALHSHLRVRGCQGGGREDEGTGQGNRHVHAVAGETEHTPMMNISERFRLSTPPRPKTTATTTMTATPTKRSANGKDDQTNGWAHLPGLPPRRRGERTPCRAPPCRRPRGRTRPPPRTYCCPPGILGRRPGRVEECWW